MHRFTFLSGLIILVFLAGLSLAEIPKMINYQGMVTDGEGAPLGGSFYMSFRIYTDSTSTSPTYLRWNETHGSVEVRDGLFNVILGSETVGGINLDFSEEYWLEVQVDADTMPRIRFTSVGYAYRALVADSALVAGSGGGGGGGWTDAGTVVRLETDTDSVGIGTATPATKLDVNGDVNINSVYKIGGETVLSAEGTQNTLVGVGAGSNNQTQGNTFLGYEAGTENTDGFFNTFLGSRAGHENLNGARNTFLGYNAGYYSRSGDNNTFLGYYAGYGHKGSAGEDDNVFVGHFAGFSDTSGYNNTFMGTYAGYSNKSSYQNTFVGCRAGYFNTGNRNTFLGCGAGEYNEGGYYNTYAGGYSGWNNHTGYCNAYFGYGAGYNSASSGGSCNTYIGYFAGEGSQDGDSNVFIGYNAGKGEIGSSKLIIANGPDTANVLIYGNFTNGQVGIGTMNTNSTLHIDGSVAKAVTHKTADYSATSSDCIILADASSGSVTISLPDPSTVSGRVYTIKRTDDATNFVFVDDLGGGAIDGDDPYLLSAQYEYVTVVSDGSGWWVIGK
jgi:hypothetical protein